VSVVFALTILPVPSTPAAMDFTFQLLIQMSNKDSSQIRAIAPANSIGEAGGFWATTQYNRNGVDPSHYPVYMDSPATACTPVCLIHVKSRVVHTYTLGDFFTIWGKPLGQNDTLGIPSNGTFQWQLCIGPPGGNQSSNEWGGLVLQSRMQITLFFYDTTALGCAPS
jgi:hypothetical protein